MTNARVAPYTYFGPQRLTDNQANLLLDIDAGRVFLVNLAPEGKAPVTSNPNLTSGETEPIPTALRRDLPPKIHSYLSTWRIIDMGDDRGAHIGTALSLRTRSLTRVDWDNVTIDRVHDHRIRLTRIALTPLGYLAVDEIKKKRSEEPKTGADRARAARAAMSPEAVARAARAGGTASNSLPGAVTRVLNTWDAANEEERDAAVRRLVDTLGSELLRRLPS